VTALVVIKAHTVAVNPASRAVTDETFFTIPCLFIFLFPFLP
jgi:hypothetical protein